MIRTLVTLRPGIKQDGGRCLKGELSRDFVATSADGSERQYPAGTNLVLVKNRRSETYSLLALLDSPVEEFEAERKAALNQEDIPF